MVKKVEDMRGEDDVKDAIKEILDRYAEMHWDMPPASMHGVGGRHDFLICQKGLFWTIEAKFATNGPSALQIKYARNIAKAGGISLLINENTLGEVEYVADYIQRMGKLPAGHNFDSYK